VESRFPATLGDGKATIDLSDGDLGTKGTGALNGNCTTLENAAGDTHNGSGTFKRRNVELKPADRKRVETTVMVR
jgi:hypothetical protein